MLGCARWQRLNVSGRFRGVGRSVVRDTIYTNKGIRTNLINGSPMEIIRHCFMTTALSFSSGASEIQLGSEREMSGRHGKHGQINELEMSENYK